MAPPFKYLQRNTVITPCCRGVVLSESFEATIFRHDWFLWMREPGKVGWRNTEEGEDGSRCLLITSDSEQDWLHLYTKFVKVRGGERFLVRARARVFGEKAGAALRIAAFDAKKQVVNWVYAEAKTDSADEWVELARHLVVEKGVAYLKVGLAGKARGSFYFDDVVLILE